MLQLQDQHDDTTTTNNDPDQHGHDDAAVPLPPQPSIASYTNVMGQMRQRSSTAAAFVRRTALRYGSRDMEDATLVFFRLSYRTK